MTNAMIKWEPKDDQAGEWRAYVGKIRLREWKEQRGVKNCNCYNCRNQRPAAWQSCEWSIEGYECRVLASGGAPTRKAARMMAEAAAHAAVKAGLR